MITKPHKPHGGTWERAIPPFLIADDDPACRPDQNELFYPEQGQPAAKAKAICWPCPHRHACLVWALETRQAFGVWGGKTVSERAEILRARGAAV